MSPPRPPSALQQPVEPDLHVGNDPTVYHYSFTVRPEKVGTNNGKGDDKKGDHNDDKGGKKDR